MKTFKKLVIMGKLKGIRVLDNSNNDEETFCYMNHIEREPYNLRGVCSPQRRKPTVVTSTRFDNDDAFADVARAMLFRYEHEQMTERETINAILSKPEEVQAFLEALDLKYAAACTNESDIGEDLVGWETNEIVLQIRSIFLPTLQSTWQESVAFEKNSVTTSMIAIASSDEPATVQEVDDQYYRKQPRTPKNLCLSPVACAYTTNDSILIKDGGNCIQTPSKRRRRWFFSETRSDRPVQRSFTSTLNPFASGKKVPELRFEFCGKQSLTSSFDTKINDPIVDYALGSALKGALPVESLQCYHFGSKGGTYTVSTSPIRKVSIELDHSR
jgi:hypothetical protein